MVPWRRQPRGGIFSLDKATNRGGLWYAQFIEENKFVEEKLGIEGNLVLSAKQPEGLNVDLIGVCLFGGDAASSDGDNEADPFEIGTWFFIRL